ncbi:MAG: exodeoxyribonuclease III [Pseudolabrys sp.]|nr:exodeoxyribonuclease III [Pseudolabrys sp.]
MRVATWNVNSVRLRAENIAAWLAERSPDVVCLQEIKCVDEAFPRETFERLGYNVAVHGQKGFNGVALLSKRPFEDVTPGLHGDDSDVQARFLEAVVSTQEGVVRIVTLYLPNGNPPHTEKYDYKIKWMDRLIRFSRERLMLEEPLVVCGDFNVIPASSDAKNPAAWVNDALFLPQTREKFRALTNLGLTDAIRAVSDSDQLFTFWDYQAGAWQRDNGIRIDHILLSPQATDRLVDAGIDKHVRGWDKPSDHVPIYVDLDIAER